MKKLDQFILKSFVGPFIAILLVVVFILMMQFLWLYIDELVVKDGYRRKSVGRQLIRAVEENFDGS